MLMHRTGGSVLTTAPPPLCPCWTSWINAQRAVLFLDGTGKPACCVQRQNSDTHTGHRTTTVTSLNLKTWFASLVHLCDHLVIFTVVADFSSEPEHGDRSVNDRSCQLCQCDSGSRCDSSSEVSLSGRKKRSVTTDCEKQTEGNLTLNVPCFGTRIFSPRIWRVCLFEWGSFFVCVSIEYCDFSSSIILSAWTDKLQGYYLAPCVDSVDPLISNFVR